MNKWLELKRRIALYELYVSQLKQGKSIISKIEYKKHKWFLSELTKIVDDIEK